MQERQKSEQHEKESGSPVSKTAPAGTLPETADNPRSPFTKYELSTPTGFATHPAHARYAKSHHLEHFIFTTITIRLIVVQFQSLEGQLSCIPLIPAKSWQIWVARTTSTQPGAHHAAQAPSEPQDTIRSSPLLAIVLVDFFPSFALNLQSFVGDCKQQTSKYSPFAALHDNSLS
jgi:hypothetical protein